MRSPGFVRVLAAGSAPRVGARPAALLSPAGPPLIPLPWDHPPRCLIAKAVSGVAIVGPRGDLTGHLSASDARCLRPGVYSQLLLPVREFLSMHAARAPRGSGGGGGAAPLEPSATAGALPLDGRVLCAQPTSCLGTLITALVRQRVHRVYVTDSDSNPVGIVTCTDVLNLLEELCGTETEGARAETLDPVSA
jgi:CBS domain-containing protein